jgi:hypothetical protein
MRPLKSYDELRLEPSLSDLISRSTWLATSSLSSVILAGKKKRKEKNKSSYLDNSRNKPERGTFTCHMHYN